MSEPLTDAAPGVEADAVSSVEDVSAQTQPTAVVEASGVPEGYIEKDRFNGLMSKFHQMQNERDALAAEVEAIRTQLSTRPEPEAPENMSELAELQGQVEALTSLLMSKQVEEEKAKVLAEFPEAAPFSDLIVANTPDEYRRMAEEIANRAKGIAPATASEPVVESETTTETPTTDEPPVLSGAPATGLSTPVGADDEATEALRKGDFQSYFKAKKRASVEALTVG